MKTEAQRIAILKAMGWTQTEPLLDGRRCFEPTNRTMNDTPTPTPRTDEWLAEEKRNPRISGLGNWLDYCKTLERELTAVTEQRDGLRAGIDCASDQLRRVTEQRDRLAEALKRIANNNVQDEPHTCYAYEFGRMEGIAKIALAAVKGGSDE